MSLLLSCLFRIYRRLINLYPPSYHEEFGDELSEVFEQSILESNGSRQILSQVLKELLDFPGVLLRVNFRWRPVDMHSNLFPQSSDQTPWRTALLSLLPFLFIGPLSLINSYLPLGNVQWQPWSYSLVFGIDFVLMFVGFVLGLIKKFPRWSYPYTVLSITLITVLVTQPVNRYSPIEGGTLVLVVAAILFFLATWWLAPFRPFYQNIRQDWTVLSYGLYGIAILVLSGTDLDEAPRLTFLVLLPSLISIAAALAHLRLSSAYQKVVVLVISNFLCIFLLYLPVFNGMRGGWLGFLAVFSVVLGLWGLLSGLVLAPILVGVYNRRLKPA